MSQPSREREQRGRPHCELAARADGYERRRPEATVLYQCIAQHWPGFAERIEEQGGHDFDRLIVGHGDPLQSGGHDAIATAYDWLRS